MKMEDIKNLFSNFTTVKIVEHGTNDVWKGFFYEIPFEYKDRRIDTIIPIVNPENNKIGMAVILLEEK